MNAIAGVAVLLGGIVLGAVFFAALLWSFAQALLRTGALRWSHAAAAAATILAMICLTYQAAHLAPFAGGALVLAGIAATWVEERWNRLLPAAQALCGAAIAAGLPFGGA